MKKSYFVSILACLVLFSVCVIVGCGNVSGGGNNAPAADTLTADIYVSTSGSDDAGTGSASSPFETIQHAMDVCASYNVIGIFNGIYKENVTWTTREYVTLKGESKAGAIISSEIQDRCIFINDIAAIPNNQTITIESLTVTNGHCPSGSTRGTGICFYKNNVNLHVKDIIFKTNGHQGTYNAYGALGLGATTKAYVENCEFNDNRAISGAAIYSNDNVQLLVYKCTFHSNSSESGSDIGGAVYVAGTVTFEACDFYENTSLNGGGAYNARSGFQKLRNCIFFNNKTLASHGGAISVHPSATPEIVNCTIVSNETGVGGNGGGIYVSDSTIISNCIIWGNWASGGNDVLIPGAGGTTVIKYSDISWWGMSNAYSGGQGTLEVAPIFSRTLPPYSAASDFVLSGPGTVTQGGTIDATVPKDYAGNNRTGHNSMGAYQY